MKNLLEKEIYLHRTVDRYEDIRGPFFRDQTAIIHSLSFRRLKHKTQVFFSPENDHVCTRIEHVMHVATIAATICKGLKKYGWELDSEMAFAIGLAHDLGHAPFGHAGEAALNSVQKEVKFIHEVNSYRIVEQLDGLNLTYGVKDGVICHNGERFEQYLIPRTEYLDLDTIADKIHVSCSYEGCIVRFSDKIAYLGRDIEDAISAGIITTKDIPDSILKFLGAKNGEIINSLVIDFINNSRNRDMIGFSDEKFDLIVKLKKFNYNKIYNHKKLLEYTNYSKRVIEILYNYLYEKYTTYSFEYEAYMSSNMKIDLKFAEYLEKMHDFYKNEKTSSERIIIDYISGMTDPYALECVKNIIIPKSII